MSLSLNRDKGPVKAQTMPTKARAKPVAKKAARPANVAPEALSARVLRLLDRMPAIPPGKNGDVEVKVSSIKAGTPVDKKTVEALGFYPGSGGARWTIW